MISRDEVLKNAPIFNDYGEEILMAGQWAKAGHYRMLDSTRIIHHKADGPLPASLDGHRAEYCRFEQPWISLNSQAEFKREH